MADTLWLNVAKSGYVSTRRPYDKEKKAFVEWLDVSVRSNEFTWKKVDDKYILLFWVESAPTGISVSSTNKEKVKFPCVFKLEMEGKDSWAEKALIKALESSTEQGKFYAATASLLGAGNASQMFAEGKKSDGTPLTESELKFMSGQFMNSIESAQKNLTDELLAVALKAEESGSWGRGASINMESTQARVDYRVGKIKEMLGLKGDASLADVATEVAATAKAVEMHETNFISLLTALLD